MESVNVGRELHRFPRVRERRFRIVFRQGCSTGCREAQESSDRYELIDPLCSVTAPTLRIGEADDKSVASVLRGVNQGEKSFVGCVTGTPGPSWRSRREAYRYQRRCSATAVPPEVNSSRRPAQLRPLKQSHRRSDEFLRVYKKGGQKIRPDSDQPQPAMTCHLSLVIKIDFTQFDVFTYYPIKLNLFKFRGDFIFPTNI